MRKLRDNVRAAAAVLLLLPAAAAWLPADVLRGIPWMPAGYADPLAASFRKLAATLAAAVSAALVLAAGTGFLSVLWRPFGRMAAAVLDAIESVPSILVVLFCYAPVSGYLARSGSSVSAAASLAVFAAAAAATSLPEAARSIAIPLSDLYHRKYSASFRSYGFRKSAILGALFRSAAMREALGRTAATLFLKVLVLDCSFGFIVQLGFGAYGTPAHASPGALVASNRDALFAGGDPRLFWIPVAVLACAGGAFLIMTSAAGEDKE